MLLATKTQISKMADPLISTALNVSEAGTSICAKENIPAIKKLGEQHQSAIKVFLFVFGETFYTITPQYALFELNMNDYARDMNLTIKLYDKQHLQFLHISQGNKVAENRITEDSTICYVSAQDIAAQNELLREIQQISGHVKTLSDPSRQWI